MSYAGGGRHRCPAGRATIARSRESRCGDVEPARAARPAGCPCAARRPPRRRTPPRARPASAGPERRRRRPPTRPAAGRGRRLPTAPQIVLGRCAAPRCGPVVRLPRRPRRRARPARPRRWRAGRPSPARQAGAARPVPRGLRSTQPAASAAPPPPRPPGSRRRRRRQRRQVREVVAAERAQQPATVRRAARCGWRASSFREPGAPPALACRSSSGGVACAAPAADGPVPVRRRRWHAGQQRPQPARDPGDADEPRRAGAHCTPTARIASHDALRATAGDRRAGRRRYRPCGHGTVPGGCRSATLVGLSTTTRVSP